MRHGRLGDARNGRARQVRCASLPECTSPAKLYVHDVLRHGHLLELTLQQGFMVAVVSCLQLCLIKFTDSHLEKRAVCAQYTHLLQGCRSSA